MQLSLGMDRYSTIQREQIPRMQQWGLASGGVLCIGCWDSLLVGSMGPWIMDRCGR